MYTTVGSLVGVAVTRAIVVTVGRSRSHDTDTAALPVAALNALVARSVAPPPDLTLNDSTPVPGGQHARAEVRSGGMEGRGNAQWPGVVRSSRSCANNGAAAARAAGRVAHPRPAACRTR